MITSKEILEEQLRRLAKYQLDTKCYCNNGNIEIKDVNGKCVFKITEANFDEWLGEALKTLVELNHEASDEVLKLALALSNYI